MNKAIQQKSIYIIVIILAALLISGNAFPGKNGPPSHIPEFTQKDPNAWINSAPLAVKELRGKVVLVDIWTFACWNCYRSFPWLNSLEAKFADENFQVIGIHTPEFEREKERNSVVGKIEEFKLHHPVMIDNDFAYWESLNNQYWPAYYIVDKKGKIRGLFIGETHDGDERAEAIEKLIAKLIKE